MTITLLLISCVIAALSGLPGLALPRRSRLGQWIAVTLIALGSAIGIIGIILFWIDPPSGVSLTANWTLPAGRFSIGVDGLAIIFLIPVFVISALGAIYGLGYWSQQRHPRTGSKLRVCWGMMTAGMILVVLARDGVLFLLSWEVMALAGFFLVTTESQKPAVRHAGWIYLIATHVGALCLFGFFALLKQSTGSFELWPSGLIALSPAAVTGLFVLGVIGFGVKAGLMPLHVWLPGAHANAPSHVSAMMSGVLLKMGVYGIIRVGAMIPHPPLWWGGSLLLAGTLSGILGIAFASGQRDLKRLLAYSSIENIGMISMGIGLALMGRSLDRADWVTLGMAGALLHVLNHSLFKPLLFMGAGSVLHAARTRMIDRLGGLAKAMPATFVFFLIGAMAICGLPPFNGFVSEVLIYLGLFRSIAIDSPTWGWIALAAPALALIGALSLATFVKLVGLVFLGTARSSEASRAHESPGFMRAPMAVLATGCALIGILPVLLVPLLQRSIEAWSTIPLVDYTSLWWVSALAIVLLLLVGTSAVLIAALLGKRSRRGALTWDCGYAKPTLRMQYTGSSFSQMLIELLGWIVWPRINQPKITGVFARKAIFSSEVPDVVLDRALAPAMATADAALGQMRILQRGTVQRYLLYIMGILVVLLFFR